MGTPDAERRRYTDEEKAEALRLYADIGGGPTSRELGIPIGTLTRWASQARVESPLPNQGEKALAAAKIHLSHLARQCAEVAEGMLVRAADHGTSASDRKQLAVAAAVLIDKAHLLSGGVTARTVSEDPEALREEAGRLRDELAERRRERESVPEELPAVAGGFVAPDF